jgi:succinate dehydrogenase / fumarate reductase membrane anchor subunit
VKGLNLKGLFGRLMTLKARSPALHHWWWQRITALLLVPLGLWFAASLVKMAGAEHAAAAAWVGSPGAALLLCAFVLALCYHAYLGVEVVLDDYVHIERVKSWSLLAVKFILAVLAVIGVVSILWVVVA